MAVTLLRIDVNGVEVPIVFEKDSRLPLTTVEFIFKESGAMASSNSGLVTLAADLLNEGTGKDGSLKFAEELESRAVELSAHTGAETFVFTIDTIKEQFDFGLKKLIELIKDPNYAESTFEKIVKKRAATLVKKNDDFDYIASNGLKEILFEGSNLALPKLGTKKSIENIHLHDLREYIESHLHSNNLIVVAGGDFNEDEIKTVAKKFASSLIKSNVGTLNKVSASANKTRKEINEKTEQAYIYFGAPYNMEVNSPKRTVGEIASFILGSGGFGSRLMEEIRVKRGLAYSAYSHFLVNKTNSYFTGYLQTKLESQEEAVKTVKDLVADFVKNGVTKEELSSAKKFFLGSEPLRVETLHQRVNRAFNEYYSEQGLGFFKKKLETIEHLTLTELNNFIKEHTEILKMSFFIVTKK